MQAVCVSLTSTAKDKLKKCFSFPNMGPLLIRFCHYCLKCSKKIEVIRSCFSSSCHFYCGNLGRALILIPLHVPSEIRIWMERPRYAAEKRRRLNGAMSAPLWIKIPPVNIKQASILVVGRCHCLDQHLVFLNKDMLSLLKSSNSPATSLYPAPSLVCWHVFVPSVPLLVR